MLKLFMAALASLSLSVSPAIAQAGIVLPSPQVELKTNVGEIVLELDAQRAPATVENFLRYVRDGHYAGTVFHRVIDGFMIQGGGFDLQLEQKPTRPAIQNEADNGLKNLQYTIAMARTSDPHSATAQFFINVADNGFLDHTAKTSRGWGYAVFGKVVKGSDVVWKISKMQTGGYKQFPSDVPVKPVVIQSARVLDAPAGSGKTR